MNLQKMTARAKARAEKREALEAMKRAEVAKLSKREMIKLAGRAFLALDVLNNQKWTSYREVLFKECVGEEKEHRGSRGPFGASVADAARQFAVKRVAQYMRGDEMPRGKDYLRMQRSCFTAAGLVDEYREEIAKAWAGMDVELLAELDYVALIATGEDSK